MRGGNIEAVVDLAEELRAQSRRDARVDVERLRTCQRAKSCAAESQRAKPPWKRALPTAGHWHDAQVDAPMVCVAKSQASDEIVPRQ